MFVIYIFKKKARNMEMCNIEKLVIIKVLCGGDESCFARIVSYRLYYFLRIPRYKGGIDVSNVILRSNIISYCYTTKWSFV